MRAIFQKKGKISEKFGQKCTKFENILKKGTWLRTIIAHIKLLEKALTFGVVRSFNINPVKCWLQSKFEVQGGGGISQVLPNFASVLWI